MNALLQLIPLAHKLIPDADKARELAGQIHLAAINKINEYVYSLMAVVFGGAFLYQSYQIENGLPVNALSLTLLGVKFAVFLLLLGVKAKEAREFWKLAGEIREDIQDEIGQNDRT